MKKDTHDPRSLFKLLTKEKKSIIRAGADEVMIFEQGSIGPLDENNPCPCRNGHVNAYLIWNAGEKHLIKKYDCCHVYKQKEIPADLFSFLRIHQTAIDTEEIKSKVYVIYYRFRHIHAFWHGKRFDFQLHDCDFSPSNRPYDKENNALLVKQWCEQISKEIDKLESSGFLPEKDMRL